MPVFQAPEPQFQAPPRQPARQAQPTRQARNDRYLPPMPEMLRPVENAPDVPPRYAQGSPKNPVKPEMNKGMLVRAQAGEEQTNSSVTTVPTAKLLMPSPEELGLAAGGAPNPASVDGDWNAARRRLDALGACYYRLEKADQGFRFTCSLPYAGDPNRERHFETLAASEADAIRMALEQVDDWKSARR
jgi:hypothetical protein